MSDAAELLLDLKDIQEPIAPATSAAWLLGLFILAACVLIVALFAYLFWRRKALNRALQQELLGIRELDQHHGLHQLAVLLRRIMHYMHGDSINQLQNEQWLAHLDNSFSTNYFSEGRGAIFGEVLYQPNNPTNPSARTNIPQLCNDLHKLIGRAHLRPHA